ncbi:hypothetical protein D0Y65_023807 [Glycine soja]|uniref:CCHC-type domain-containing protein n=1 Tax=Glycine soja TaxID=3848 RepID=A0A445IZL5_GLYSO|nr:hypothetical protein D0Y65_023807 [Glycine soja]
MVTVLGKRVGYRILEAKLKHGMGKKGWCPFFLANLTELFNDNLLYRLGSTLGQMLKIDKVTSVQVSGRFARICIEIDLDKPLQPKIILLIYGSLHHICFNCGRYGHRDNACLEKKATNVEVIKERHVEVVEAMKVQKMMNEVVSTPEISMGKMTINENIVTQESRALVSIKSYVCQNENP